MPDMLKKIHFYLPMFTCVVHTVSPLSKPIYETAFVTEIATFCLNIKI